MSIFSSARRLRVDNPFFSHSVHQTTVGTSFRADELQSMIRARQVVTKTLLYLRFKISGASRLKNLSLDKKDQCTGKKDIWQTAISIETPPAYPPSRGISDGE